MYIYIGIYIHIYIHTCESNVQLCVYTYVYVHVYTYACMYIYECMYISICMYACMYTDIHTYIHIYVHDNRDTYVYRYIWMSLIHTSDMTHSQRDLTHALVQYTDISVCASHHFFFLLDSRTCKTHITNSYVWYESILCVTTHESFEYTKPVPSSWCAPGDHFSFF